jgi:hypothetical protein
MYETRTLPLVRYSGFVNRDMIEPMIHGIALPALLVQGLNAIDCPGTIMTPASFPLPSQPCYREGTVGEIIRVT